MLSDIFRQLGKTFKSNAPEILTALAASGVASTTYLAVKAGMKASRLIEEDESKGGVSDNSKINFKRRASLTWKCYIPVAVSGGLTVTCVIMSARVNSRRTAAAVTAYSLTEKAFAEYKEKVVEQLGKGKEQKVRDEIAQEKVANKPTSQEVMVVGPGHVMCCELYSGRYFRSTMEDIRKALNEINAKIVRDAYVTLDEFYDILNLSHTSHSAYLGWDSDKLLELTFSAVLSNGEPCLAFEYNYVKPLK